MIFEWGRLWYWLNQSSGAVQAISAVLVAFLTAVLILVTWWYARLTKTMAGVMVKDLASTLTPDISLRFGRLRTTDPFQLVLTNHGQRSVRICECKVLPNDSTKMPDGNYIDYPLNLNSRVITPNVPLHLDVSLPDYMFSPELGINSQFKVYIIVEDMGEMFRHKFTAVPGSGIYHRRLEDPVKKGQSSPGRLKIWFWHTSFRWKMRRFRKVVDVEGEKP